MQEIDKIHKKYATAISLLERQVFDLEQEHDREDQSESDLETEKRQKTILRKIQSIGKKIALLIAKREVELDEYYEKQSFEDLVEEKPTEVIAPKRYVVKEIVKFGMLFGYAVYDTKEGKKTPYEYDEDDKWRAESKCELLNAYSALQ